MGGSLGGSTSTEVSIPAWLQEAAQSGLARGQQAAGIGYTPYRGPDVAALTPMQEAAMANTSAASSAFGLGASPLPGAGMPAAQTFAGGVRGYSSAPLYDQAVNELKMRDPAQYAKLMAPFSGGGQFGITSMPMGGGAPQSYGQPMRDPNEPRQGSASSRNTSFDTYSTKAAAATRAAAGSKGSSSAGSYLPGGVNTRNPTSALNQAAARLTSTPQKAPAASSRPAAKSTSTSKSVSDSRSKASSSSSGRKK